MKPLIYVAAIVACTVLLIPGCGSSAAAGSGETVMIYTSMYGDVVDTMQRILAVQFPRYNIEFSYGGTGTLQARIASEKESGRLGCDILMVADPAYSLELKEQGMLHPHISVEAPNLAFDYDPEGCWYPVRIS